MDVCKQKQLEMGSVLVCVGYVLGPIRKELRGESVGDDLIALWTNTNLLNNRCHGNAGKLLTTQLPTM